MSEQKCRKVYVLSRKYSCLYNGGFEITIKAAVFLFKKWICGGGVLKSPFSKDTAVSGRYCHVRFYFFKPAE